MNAVQEAGRLYMERGYYVVWMMGNVPYRTNWQHYFATMDDYREGHTVAIALGVYSHNLVCVELRTRQAVDLAHMLPETHLLAPGMLFYRASGVAGEYADRDGGPVTMGFGNPNAAILGTGHLLPAPTWTEFGEPTEIDYPNLCDVVGELIEACE